MATIIGEYELNISIDGDELDFSRTVFEELSIFEAVADAVPTFKLTIHDDPGSLSAPRLFDGALVEISYRSIRVEGDPYITSRFRVFQVRVDPGTANDAIQIWGYYDAPDYFKVAGFDFVEGTSSRVARTLASKSNLSADVDSSNDQQVWIRHGMTGYLFLLEVARTAYLNDTSAYLAAITREGELRYFNVGERRFQEPIWRFVSADVLSDLPGANEMTVVSYYTTIDSGLLNRFAGYGDLGKEFRIVDGIDGTPEDIAVRSLDKSTSVLQVNSELLEPTRYQNSPWNVGNVHDNYTKASLQNTRILSTFSTNQRVYTTNNRGVNLLDRAEVLIHNQSGNRDLSRDFMSGTYFVDRIVSNFAPKGTTFGFNLTREGFDVRNLPSTLL